MVAKRARTQVFRFSVRWIVVIGVIRYSLAVFPLSFLMLMKSLGSQSVSCQLPLILLFLKCDTKSACIYYFFLLSKSSSICLTWGKQVWFRWYLGLFSRKIQVPKSSFEMLLSTHRSPNPLCCPRWPEHLTPNLCNYNRALHEAAVAAL